MSSSHGKPSRSRADYFSSGRLAGEEGTLFKDWGGRYPFAMVYPNRYFVGMSNLGVQVIYSLLNRLPEVVCERVFWEADGRPLLSLESSRPLMDYACLAFSFSYELDYLNLPVIMKAAGIPLYAGDRGASYPLLIAGGPCMSANPAPVASFFDAVCIGEAEAILPAMLPVLTADLSREEQLSKLAAVPGVYVPALDAAQPVRRRYLEVLDDFPAHSTVLTHDTELGDLYLIEVERGCSAACSFCLVSHCFRPLRFHSLESLLEQAREGLRYRKRAGLVGPVVTDHPQIESLLSGLLEMGMGFSLSSLRLKRLSPKILELMIAGGAQTIALAPEAGSERLRDMIHKGFNEDDIIEAVGKVAMRSFKQLKLYYMFGLPTEEDADADAIAALSLKCQRILDRAHKNCRISVNLSPFVPKAGTAFERRGMADVAVLEARLEAVRRALGGSGIEIKAESPAWSHMQGMLSRGGMEMARAIAAVERVSPAGWKKALEQAGLGGGDYTAEWDEARRLHWDNIAL
ncbi:MAG: B12-binding domain-containing radical SAM protein [Dehalococcoidia bacterium]|nr:B12-binding domain-containing radical SAM protein [Dehalococcoidia bacterium]